jgi:Ca2+/H+ antiporter
VLFAGGGTSRSCRSRPRIVLVLTYVAGVFFSLRTHKDLFNPDHAAEDHVGEP